MVCFFFNMDVGSFLRKLFGEPVRGANIFLFGPNKLHTTTYSTTGNTLTKGMVDEKGRHAQTRRVTDANIPF